MPERSARSQLALENSQYHPASHLPRIRPPQDFGLASAATLAVRVGGAFEGREAAAGSAFVAFGASGAAFLVSQPATARATRAASSQGVGRGDERAIGAA